MRKKEWANAVWLLFHTLAEKLKPEFSASEAPVLFSHMVDICYNLPCPDCQGHATAYMQKANKPLVTASRENLMRFLWEFHNNVNLRIKQPLFMFTELDRYKRANTRGVVLHFINIMSKTAGSEKVMMHNYHRKMYVAKFRDYIQANAYKFAA